MRTFIALLLTCMTALATDIIPNPSAPGNLGKSSQPFTNIYGVHFWSGGVELTNSSGGSVQTNISYTAVTNLNAWSSTNLIPIANIVTPGQIITNGNSTSVTFSNAVTVTGIQTNKSGLYFGPNGERLDSAGLLYCASIYASGYWQTYSLKPGSTTLDLGASNHQWQDLYLLRNAYALALVVTNNATIGGTLTATNGVISGAAWAGGTNTAPVNAVTPVLWHNYTNNGNVYKVPLYQ